MKSYCLETSTYTILSGQQEATLLEGSGSPNLYSRSSKTSSSNCSPCQGTTTHIWKDGETTIDLTFGSEGVACRTIYCRVDTSRDCDSDHLPVSTAIAWDWMQATPTKKRVWTKTNWSTLRQTVTARLPRALNVTELGNERDIDRYVGLIINALCAGIDASTPWSDPSPRSIPGFGPECTDICRRVQQLRRRWQRTRSDEHYEAYREARNKKGRHIQKLLRNTHRQRVEDASG